MAKRDGNKVPREQTLAPELVLGENWQHAFGRLPVDVGARMHMQHLWATISDQNSFRLCDPLFFGESARVVLVDPADPDNPEDITFDVSDDPRVAVANWKGISAQWRELLEHDCWKGQLTYPPAGVLQRVAETSYHVGLNLSCAIWLANSDGESTVDFLERKRAEGNALFGPIITMFLASTQADAQQSEDPPAERPDFTGFSSPREKKEWLRVFKHFGIEMSEDTFKRRRDEGEYQEHDATKLKPLAKRIRLRISCLPAGYDDSSRY